MYKESLFELIRKEEVVIWAGAGLSLYAGFPGGKELKEILLNSLSKSEREPISCDQHLSTLAEEFFRIKNNNRNSLIRVLNQTFLDRKPISTELHLELAKIPHFNTIITTNYDTLIEDAFAQDGQIAYSAKQIPYLESGKTHIFKVHGDLKEPDSIIITNSDYESFFKLDSEDGVFWTVIKERLSTNSVLFLGYNLDDPNVSVVFDKITNELGANRKECFLIAPNLTQPKINNLAHKEVQYINSTAEEFVSQLLSNLKENIIEDIECGRTSADTFRRFLSNIDVLPDLKGNIDKYEVRSLRGINDTIKGTMSFTVKNDPELLKDFNDFASGKKIGTLDVTEDKLIDADFRYGGIRFPNPDEIRKLQFKSIPKVVTSIDIRFEDGTELVDVPTKIFGAQNHFEIHLELKSATFIVKFDLAKAPEAKFTFDYKHNEICNNVNEEIELFSFMKSLGNGVKFKAFAKTGEIYENPFPPMEEMKEDSIHFLGYFNGLKKIEQHYGIRFSNIGIRSINKSTHIQVSEINSIMDGKTLNSKWDDELTMELIEDYSEETIKQLKAVNESRSPMAAFENTEEIIELHGQKINLGYKKVAFQDPYITNLQEIIDRKGNIAKLVSRSKKMLISYSKEKITE